MRTIRIEIDVPDSCEGCRFRLDRFMTKHCRLFITKEKKYRTIHNNKPCTQCREATVKEG